MNAIFTRSSVRAFEDKPVEREKIELILKAAMSAPTAVNQRPWEFFVVTNREKLEKLSKVSPYAGMVAKAPVAIVICYHRDCRLPEFAHIDCSIAAENIWLEFEELGLGGVMLGVAPYDDRIKLAGEIIELPENLVAFTIIPFGYPKSKHEQKDRFESDRVHWIE